MSCNKSELHTIWQANNYLPQETLPEGGEGVIQVLTKKNFYGYKLHGREGHNNAEDMNAGNGDAEDELVKVNPPLLWDAFVPQCHVR